MKQKAIFLDRDGVLSQEQGYVTSLEQFHIFQYTKECITKIHQKGYLAIVITNQSAVGRGMITEDELLALHAYLKSETGVDAIYYCPHWYQDGMKQQSPYQQPCTCRKPKTGLLEQAVADFSIQLEGSYFVGDRVTDIQAGQRMHLKTVLLESGYGLERLEGNIEIEQVYKDLEEFVEQELIRANNGCEK